MLTTLKDEIISRMLKLSSLKTHPVKKLVPVEISTFAKILSPKELPSYLPNLRDIIPGVTLLKPSVKSEVEFPNNIRIFLTPYTKTFKILINEFLSL